MANLRDMTNLTIQKEVERVAGVEPASLAWEARVIPIYDTRNWCIFNQLHHRRVGILSHGHAIVTLKISEVGIYCYAMSIPETKTDTPRVIPLPERAQVAIRAILKRRERYPSLRTDSISQAFARACDRLWYPWTQVPRPQTRGHQQILWEGT